MANNKNYKGKGYGKSGSNRGANNGKGHRGKGASKMEEPRATRGKSEPSTNNDASWYSNITQLTADVARFSFGNPLGHRVPIFPKREPSWPSYDYTVPGICAIPLITGPGTSTDRNSAVNIAAKNFHSFINHKNSRNANYDPADLMMYMLAMDSVYQFYAVLVRLYGTAMFYSARNRYYGRALIEAQGFDPDSIQNNLADLRYYINLFVSKANQLHVPATASIFKRHAWLYSGLYLDNDDIKSQIYMYVPAGFYFYQEKEEGQPGHLEFKKWGYCANLGKEEIPGDNLMGITSIVATMNEMLNRVRESQDIGMIGADIEKAYDPSQLLTLATIPDDFTVVPSYSPEVLTQIHNATLNGVNARSVSGVKLDITQCVDGDLSGSILWTPSCMSSQYDYINDQCAIDMDTHEFKLIDSHSANPTPDEVMVATRLTTITKHVDKGSHADVEFICGTEFACNALIYVLNGSTVESYPVSHFEYANGTIDRFLGWSKLTKFNEHPIVHIGYATVDDTSQFVMPELLGDVDNYTYVHKEDIMRMHEVATLSMWQVPEFGKMG